MAKVKVVEFYCKGCGLCVEVCPKGVLAMDEKANAQGVRPALVCEEDACITCGRCVMMCPDAAIVLEEGEEALVAKSSRSAEGP